MKSMALSLAATAALWTAVPASAQDDASTEATPSPVADLMYPDADGDGISNHLDPDFEGGRGMHGFVDADADGVNDLAQDADGDGVANGQDADYVRPAGSGMHGGQGTGMGMGTRGFVDADADGVNDLAQDADGDGVANGQDADYVRPAGTGMRGGRGMGRGMHGFVDVDADGVNDLAQDADGDGIPNGGDADYARPTRTTRKAVGMRGAARGASGRDTGR